MAPRPTRMPASGSKTGFGAGRCEVRFTPMKRHRELYRRHQGGLNRFGLVHLKASRALPMSAGLVRRSRNLRPPVLTSMKRIGLLHFGQTGGGGFLGIGRSRCSDLNQPNISAAPCPIRFVAAHDLPGDRICDRLPLRETRSRSMNLSAKKAQVWVAILGVASAATVSHLARRSARGAK